ncbi:UbiA family prenyltransferase [Promethearchaeum syntrophicum]|uniref:UbiA family prenyltransferase n=1 Tax=Promethearchaeum syntrophicum TaxID=2594042 RepID=A0A5B9D887_9ARCH|nr:UbiA family prenyltransferase [Candidatus Prometheoarchaeum syntrophicum]QEE15379.1 phosphoribose diphosphate:decaprenyl-phosphate phosphoribosyltransferase [Candidatus Prometheoarchaeum syntrophicum]
MNKILAVFNLLRIRQYYKNLIMFIGIFFAGRLFDFSIYPDLILAFIVTCLSSSISYIINDIKDLESDKLHSEKIKKRPLANGELSIIVAIILLILIVAVFIVSMIYFKNLLFLVLLLFLIANGFAYNFILKKIAFADIIGLSTNYIWRALAGCAIINIRISPWLTVTVFLTALFLATGKRIADLVLLGLENAKNHKKIYDSYSTPLLNNFLILNATALFVMYTLYCVLGPLEEGSIIPLENQGLLVYSTPVALYLIYRFIYLVKANPKIVRNAEKLITDKGMIFGGILLGIIGIISLYMELGSWAFFIQS